MFRLLRGVADVAARRKVSVVARRAYIVDDSRFAVWSGR